MGVGCYPNNFKRKEGSLVKWFSFTPFGVFSKCSVFNKKFMVIKFVIIRLKSLKVGFRVCNNWIGLRNVCLMMTLKSRPLLISTICIFPLDMVVVTVIILWIVILISLWWHILILTSLCLNDSDFFIFFLFFFYNALGFKCWG